MNCIGHHVDGAYFKSLQCRVAIVIAFDVERHNSDSRVSEEKARAVYMVRLVVNHAHQARHSLARVCPQQKDVSNFVIDVIEFRAPAMTRQLGVVGTDGEGSDCVQVTAILLICHLLLPLPHIVRQA